MKLMKTTKTMMRTAAFAAIVAASTLLPSVARAQPASAGCTPGLLPVPLPHGALAAICMPPVGWNGKLVVFAHGYVAVGKVGLSGLGRFVPLPVFRYGHCNFTPGEVLAAFGLTVSQP